MTLRKLSAIVLASTVSLGLTSCAKEEDPYVPMQAESTTAVNEPLVDTSPPSGVSAAFDPTGKADGAIPGQLDTGQPVMTFASPTAPAPLKITGGMITHVPHAGRNSAGYMQAELDSRVRRIGCKAEWPSGSTGVVALVVPSSQWGQGVLPNAGFHLSITGNGIWSLTRFTTSGSVTLATSETHGRPSGFAGAGLVTFDVTIDPAKNEAVISWPDGSEATIQSEYLGSETANFAIWELFENDGSTDSPASLGSVWASD